MDFVSFAWACRFFCSAYYIAWDADDSWYFTEAQPIHFLLSYFVDCRFRIGLGLLPAETIYLNPCQYGRLDKAKHKSRRLGTQTDRFWVKSLCKCFFDKNIKQLVIPVKTGIQNRNSSMDSRLRGNDTGAWSVWVKNCSLVRASAWFYLCWLISP